MAGGAIPEVDVNILAALGVCSHYILHINTRYLIGLADFEAYSVLPAGGSSRAQMTSRTRSPSEPRSTYHTHDLEPGSYTALRLVHIAHWSFRYHIQH